MAERWLCKRCFTTADESVEACPNCGLARGAEAPSAAASTIPEDEEPDNAAAPPPPESRVAFVPLNAPLPPIPRPSTSCQQCGSPLFAQWWNPTKGGYECRRCGSLTTGQPPAGATKARTGCFIGCAAIIGFFGILAGIGGNFQGGVGLVAFAGLVGIAGLLLSRRSTG
jgi:hypothetical protein